MWVDLSSVTLGSRYITRLLAVWFRGVGKGGGQEEGGEVTVSHDGRYWGDSRAGGYLVL